MTDGPLLQLATLGIFFGCALTPGCGGAAGDTSTEIEVEELRGTIDPEVDLAAFFDTWLAECDANEPDREAALERCQTAERTRLALQLEASAGGVDMETVRAIEEATTAATQACAPDLSEWSPMSSSYHPLLCWAARSPDPHGYLEAPRPYPPGAMWWDTSLNQNPYSRYEAERHALGVMLSMDWEQVEGGDFVLGITSDNFAEVPTRTEAVFFSDPCLGAFLDRVDLESFGGPTRPVRAWVRVDALPEIARCPGLTSIRLQDGSPSHHNAR